MLSENETRRLDVRFEGRPGCRRAGVGPLVLDGLLLELLPLAMGDGGDGNEGDGGGNVGERKGFDMDCSCGGDGDGGGRGVGLCFLARHSLCIAVL